jgi:hypothetical protein
MRTWTPADLRRFLELSASTDDRHLAAWHLLSSTGLRRGEALGLRWTDVDLEAGQASIRQTVIAVGHEVSLVMRSLERCSTDQCPFARPPLLRDVVWVEPALVVEVRSLASAEGRWLREPVFNRVVGLRALVPPGGVEEPA